MAGLYEIWRDPAKDRDDDSAWLRTCTVITTEATDALGHIHDRMPMVVGRDAIDAWLDPALTDPARVGELLTVTEAGARGLRGVDSGEQVQNNHPGLVEPIPAEESLSPGEPAQDALF